MENIYFYFKNLLRSFARVAFRIAFDKRSARPITKPKHILVIRWDGKLGDAIVSSFFYREAQKIGAKVSVVTTSNLAAMHREYFGANQVYVTAMNPNWRSLYKLIPQLKDIDTIVHPVGRIRTRELLFLAMLDPQNLFSLDDEIELVNGKMRETTASMLFNEKYSYVLHKLGVNDVDARYIVPYQTVSPTQKKERPRLIFNPFASRADKSLSKEKSVDLLRLISNRLNDWEIGILYSPTTRWDAQEIQNAAKISNACILEDIHTFEDAIAIVAEADLIVSVDTGFVHVADGLGKKLIAICATFDNNFNAWAPRLRSSTRVINCPQNQEHYLSTGKKNMDNFNEISINDALDWLKTIP